MPRSVKVAEIQEVTSNQVLLIEHEERQIALCQVGGSYYAFSNICTHQYAPLSEGWLEDFNIFCPLHGAQFDVRTGAVQCLPAVEDVQTYRVIIQGNDLLIEFEN